MVNKINNDTANKFLSNKDSSKRVANALKDSLTHHSHRKLQGEDHTGCHYPEGFEEYFRNEFGRLYPILDEACDENSTGSLI
ncbi:MAG: hypothetical protein VW378_08045 [bacterium]